MLKHLEQMITFELRELAIQAKIPQIEYLIRDELLGELEYNYWKALSEACVENYNRGGEDLTDLYFSPLQEIWSEGIILDC